MLISLSINFNFLLNVKFILLICYFISLTFQSYFINFYFLLLPFPCFICHPFYLLFWSFIQVFHSKWLILLFSILTNCHYQNMINLYSYVYLHLIDLLILFLIRILSYLFLLIYFLIHHYSLVSLNCSYLNLFEVRIYN